MPCCCQKTYAFCQKVSACDLTTFTDLFTDLANGAYIVSLDFLGSKIEVPIEVEEGNVDAGVFALNENYTYTGQVLNADGAVVPIVVGEESFDCFQFKSY